MNRTIHTIVVAGVFILAGLQTGQSQTTDKSSPTAERRDQLARVKELLSDPDPLMRLANMEAILNSGDALKFQVALSLAFRSDDPDLRGLAMRAYIASRKEIALDIQLPPELQRKFDEAQADPEKMKTLTAGYPFLNYIAGCAFRVQYAFSKYDMSSNTGVITNPARKEGSSPAPFAISGDRLNATVDTQLGGAWSKCSVDFRPTGNTFRGTLACQAWMGDIIFPKLSVSAPIL
jgi:hypothetical protein